MNDREYMLAALEQARAAAEEGEAPVGAVLVKDGRILACTHNRRESTGNPMDHAEVLALQEGAAHLGSWRLEGSTLYVTLEPCPMCAGAIFWSNVRRVVFGLSTASLNAMVGEETQDVLDLPSRELLAKGRKRIEVVGPVLEEEARRVHEGFWG